MFGFIFFWGGGGSAMFHSDTVGWFTVPLLYYCERKKMPLTRKHERKNWILAHWVCLHVYVCACRCVRACVCMCESQD